MWICLSRGYLSTSQFNYNFEENINLIESWFPGWYMPKMRYPLRGGAEIVKFVQESNRPYVLDLDKNNKRIQLPSLHLCNLEIPQNLTHSYKVELFTGRRVRR